QALSRPVGAIAKGKRADLLVLDGQHPTLIDKVDDLVLDTLVFAGNGNPVRDVVVGGQWVVRERRHVREDEIVAAFRKAMWSLTQAA
ncbi:MAG: amidohydrolase family protein, partial [Alphaproteobacteria bacterium]|nr:amidohydrolase family protein [Alphaproteobacteria bacterium]